MPAIFDKRHKIIASVLVSFAICLFIASYFVSQRAYVVLFAEESFADGPVGYDGHIPLSVTSFATLVYSPWRNLYFEKLVNAPSPAATLYGLCGLYYSDRTVFDQKVKEFRNSDAVVTHFSGCMGTQVPLRTLVHSDDPKVVRLNPNQNVRDWLREHNIKVGDSFAEDISGGAICEGMLAMGIYAFEMS